MHKSLLLFLIFCFVKTQAVIEKDAVQNGTFHISKGLSEQVLTGNWLMMVGDDAKYSDVSLNDKNWKSCSTYLIPEEMEQHSFKGSCWFRLHISIDSTIANKSYIFKILQEGASEIYFNGSLIKKIGIISDQDNKTSSGEFEPFIITPLKNTDNILAIRYQNTNYEHSRDSEGERMAGFDITVFEESFYWEQTWVLSFIASVCGIGIFGLFFSIGLVHFLLYVFYKERRSNLRFAILSLLLSYFFLHIYLSYAVVSDVNISGILNLLVVLTIPFTTPILLGVIYSLFYEKDPKLLKYLYIFSGISSIGFIVINEYGFIIFLLVTLLGMVELIRVLIYSLRNNLKGSKIIASGFSLSVVFILAFVLVGVLNDFNFGIRIGDTSGNLLTLLGILAIVGIPFSMSVFLASDFAQTNKVLAKKLIEVEELSNRSIEQEKEKQKILSEQNEKLEHQVSQRTKELNLQKTVIEIKQKEIVDSINYAKRIQYTLLAHKEFLKNNLPEHFIYFNPKDIVSGDFYWAAKKGNKFYLAVCDSTGHGVPGAFMSLLNIGFLTEAINEKGIERPDDVFDFVRQRLIDNISKEGQRDGFDGILLCIDNTTQQITYAAANNAPIIIRNNEIIECECDKMPVGIGENTNSFELYTLEVKKGDSVYLYTDGYADQFGGPKGKKFKYKHLNELLLNNVNKPLEEQHQVYSSTFNNWKGDLEQIDDVCLMGIRI